MTRKNLLRQNLSIVVIGGDKLNDFMKYEDLGLRDYKEVWDYQEKLFSEKVLAKQKGLQTEDILLFCEHPHTLTIGKNGKNENLLYSSAYLADKGVSIYKIDRGGDVTYHGPGQLVVYPIFDLESLGIGLRQYVYNLEEVMIRFLSSYNIQAERSEGATGVWLKKDLIEPKKLGAIGVKCSRYVTMHGLALNLNTDLSYFSLINPCGFTDRGVTSVKQETGSYVDMKEAKERMKLLFIEVFSARLNSI